MAKVGNWPESRSHDEGKTPQAIRFHSEGTIQEG